MPTNAINMNEPPLIISPDAPGWKLTHVEPPNGHGHAFDYYACPRCHSLFVVPVKHQCFILTQRIVLTHPEPARNE